MALIDNNDLSSDAGAYSQSVHGLVLMDTRKRGCFFYMISLFIDVIEMHYSGVYQVEFGVWFFIYTIDGECRHVWRVDDCYGIDKS